MVSIYPKIYFTKTKANIPFSLFQIESIQKLLEGWQKSLNTVINSKILLDTTPIDLASQEAMGDYSKPSIRDSSDSDSDLKTSGTDTYRDEYSLSWSQNPYKSYGYSFDVSANLFEFKSLLHKQNLFSLMK
uniref:Uncharacterized protein n=1 Tax=Pectinophora gossypiella TaxID=13191 RepID=A0A1E1WBX4_PECGO